MPDNEIFVTICMPDDQDPWTVAHVGNDDFIVYLKNLADELSYSLIINQDKYTTRRWLGQFDSVNCKFVTEYKPNLSSSKCASTF